MQFEYLFTGNGEFCGQNWGRGGVMLTPNELVFTFGFFTFVPILVKIHKEMRA